MTVTCLDKELPNDDVVKMIQNKVGALKQSTYMQYMYTYNQIDKNDLRQYIVVEENGEKQLEFKNIDMNFVIDEKSNISIKVTKRNGGKGFNIIYIDHNECRIAIINDLFYPKNGRDRLDIKRFDILSSEESKDRKFERRGEDERREERKEPPPTTPPTKPDTTSSSSSLQPTLSIPSSSSYDSNIPQSYQRPTIKTVRPLPSSLQATLSIPSSSSYDSNIPQSYQRPTIKTVRP